MDNPINPVNATRMERVQETVNTPVDPQKLAALQAKLSLPLPGTQTGGQLGADQVIISEMGKALCRFAQALERDTQTMAAFTAALPASLQEAVLHPQDGQPVNYDAALQLCMALYGPEVLARAGSYNRTRKRQIDRFDYYRALMEHFGLQYDGDTSEEDENTSLWERFMQHLRALAGVPPKKAEKPSTSDTPDEKEPQKSKPAETEGKGALPVVQDSAKTESNESGSGELPRLWP